MKAFHHFGDMTADDWLNTVYLPNYPAWTPNQLAGVTTSGINQGFLDYNLSQVPDEDRPIILGILQDTTPDFSANPTDWTILQNILSTAGLSSNSTQQTSGGAQPGANSTAATSTSTPTSTPTAGGMSTGLVIAAVAVGALALMGGKKKRRKG